MRCAVFVSFLLLSLPALVWADDAGWSASRPDAPLSVLRESTSVGLHFDPLFTRTIITDPLLGYPFKAWLVVKGIPELSEWEAAVPFLPISWPLTLVVLSATLLPLGSVNHGSTNNWIVDLPGCTPTGSENALAVVEYVLRLDQLRDDPLCPGHYRIVPTASTPSRFSPPGPGWFDCAASGAPFANVTLGTLGWNCAPGHEPPYFPTGPHATPNSGYLPLAVHFDAFAIDDETPMYQLQYYWFFDDGEFATGPSPHHTYLAAGPYLVWLNVTDGSVDRSATIPIDVTVTDAGDPRQSPSRLRLQAQQPPPLGSSTVLTFDLPDPGQVTLRIYDARGHLVARVLSEWRPAGSHSITWSGRDDTGQRLPAGIYPAGIYLGQIQACGQTQSARLVLVQ